MCTLPTSRTRGVLPPLLASSPAAAMEELVGVHGRCASRMVAVFCACVRACWVRIKGRKSTTQRRTRTNPPTWNAKRSVASSSTSRNGPGPVTVTAVVVTGSSEAAAVEVAAALGLAGGFLLLFEGEGDGAVVVQAPAAEDDSSSLDVKGNPGFDCLLLLLLPASFPPPLLAGGGCEPGGVWKPHGCRPRDRPGAISPALVGGPRAADRPTSAKRTSRHCRGCGGGPTRRRMAMYVVGAGHVQVLAAPSVFQSARAMS